MLAKQALQVGRVGVCRGIAAVREKHTLPDLPYDYNALEPVVSAEIMQIHHQKHHQAYVNVLNDTEMKMEEAKHKNDLVTMITLTPLLRFNGGGHLNHSIFWQNLSPNGGGEPNGALADQIKKDFGSFENFKTKMQSATVAIQGSGWGWLGFNKTTNSLSIAACPNQDPLEPTTGLLPLLGIDVWEHAYYLQYKNVRADYVKSIWDIVNWKDVSQRFEKAKGQH